jgi:hypothetical protein
MKGGRPGRAGKGGDRWQTISRSGRRPANGSCARAAPSSAKARDALELLEGSAAPVIYFPREDIGMAFLEKTDSRARAAPTRDGELLFRLDRGGRHPRRGLVLRGPARRRGADQGSHRLLHRQGHGRAALAQGARARRACRSPAPASARRARRSTPPRPRPIALDGEDEAGPRARHGDQVRRLGPARQHAAAPALAQPPRRWPRCRSPGAKRNPISAASSRRFTTSAMTTPCRPRSRHSSSPPPVRSSEIRAETSRP